MGVGRRRFGKALDELASATGLHEAGFLRRANIWLERDCDGLLQTLEFQPGSGSRRDTFTVNTCWRFTLWDSDSGTFHSRATPGDIAGGHDWWFGKHDVERLQRSMTHVGRLVEDHLLPYLQAHDSVDAILAAVDAETLSPRRAFGPSEDQRHLVWARCLQARERGEEAHAHFERAVELLEATDLRYRASNFDAVLAVARGGLEATG